uniref:Photosynthetic NDH subcomplex B 3 n=1 Tax=Cypripedium formosanum TaxID=53042 RepID=A0A0F7GZ25_9ASPA
MGGSVPLQLSYPLFCSAAAAAAATNPRRFLRINGAPHQKHTTCRRLIYASTDATSGSAEAPVAAAEEEPPSIDFAFVSPRLLPDGTPDIQIRLASGGQKLRDVMLDGRIDLYGPYDAPLSNCSGFGTCGTCLVEVVEGKELLSPRTEKEKETLKKKPKTWRLACQTTVGHGKDSRGQVVIQQLPEWKVIQWD